MSVEENQNWLIPVKKALQSRIDSFPEQEIRFNLMAIVSNRRMVYERKINECEQRKDAAALRMGEIFRDFIIKYFNFIPRGCVDGRNGRIN